MPGLMTHTPPSAPGDMSIAETYERLEQFLEANNNASRFTVDDDNQAMGLISAHRNDNDRVRATPVRLNRNQICNFMMTHGYECFNAEGTALSCRKKA